MSNKEIKQLKLVPRSQVEAMAQMLEAQGRRLRELEIRLQRERQEKANLEMDFHHLLDQLNGISNLSNICDDHAVICG